MFLRRLGLGIPHQKRYFSGKPRYDLTNSVAELNKEMEYIFGEPPSSANKDFMEPSSQFTSDALRQTYNNNDPIHKPQKVSKKCEETLPRLTHISSKGEAQMVDVSPKDNTKRTATASCKVILGRKVFDLVLANQMTKGDVLGVAKIAGINGAKQTSTLIPLCHNITLNHVSLDLKLNPDELCVDIEGEAACTGKTGVEMEAMTAVSVAGLTVYDMCKAASKDIQITEVRLERKTGGKNGYWVREE